MKFCWVTINVKDFDRSMEFYTKVVGLTVDKTMNPGPNMKIAFLGAGETKVELIWDLARVERDYGRDVSIGFEVESMEQILAHLNSMGVKVDSGPHQPNPTVKFLYVLDPNGLHVQFVENVKRP